MKRGKQLDLKAIARGSRRVDKLVAALERKADVRSTHGARASWTPHFTASGKAAGKITTKV